jgi:glycosyltransferase involved in cell wall biosynthesis
MRVTLVSKACVVGAYQSKLEAIAAADDVELTVVVPPYWREGGRVLPLARDHVRGYELVVAPMALNGHFHAHFYPSLPAILRRSRPDLVHMDEEPYNLATYLALRAADRVGARTLFFTWQNLLRRYPPPFSWFEGDVYRRSAGAIAGNAEALSVLGEKGFQGPVRVIPQFGIDPELFAPAEQPHNDVFTIGYAGRLVEEKGVYTLLDAAHALGGEWRLLFCGDGPLRSALSAKAATLGVGDRVQFRGYIPSSQMPTVYRQMDVLVLPSHTRPNWKEQFGRALVEAMACGVVVVGSDSGEIPNVIALGPTPDAGLVVPEGDAHELAAALSRLRDDPALRQMLAERGRQRVLERFTQAHIAAETVAFYRLLCGDHRPPHQ